MLGNRRRRSKRCYCSSSLDDSGDFSSDQAEYVISSRRNLQRAFPIQSFRVAGVTFEDRQLLVSGLEPGGCVDRIRILLLGMGNAIRVLCFKE